MFLSPEDFMEIQPTMEDHNQHTPIIQLAGE